MVSFRTFADTLVKAVQNAVPNVNVIKGQFEKITIPAPAAIVYNAPDGFDPASEWMRHGLGYIYCIAKQQADAHSTYLDAVSMAELIENALMLTNDIVTVTPAQPLTGTNYTGAVIIAYSFRYVTETYEKYQEALQNEA